MDSFKVRVEMASPLALGVLPFAPTLDSVVMALLSGGRKPERGGDAALVAQLSEIIRVDDGMPSASVLRPSTNPVWTNAIHPRSPSMEDFSYWVGGPPYDTSRGSYTTKFAYLRLATTPIWEWWGEGDVDRLGGILAHLDSLGAKRGSGYGAVTSIDVTAERAKRPRWKLFGVSSFRLGRPVPLDRLDAFLEGTGRTRSDLDPDAHAVVAFPRWPAPSWSGEAAVPTMIPVFTQ